MWSLRPERYPYLNGNAVSSQKHRLLHMDIKNDKLPEQAAIVRYLDHVDRRVRPLTRAKRKLIALLTDTEAGHHPPRVTRGLDPERAPQGLRRRVAGKTQSRSMPEHWEVRRFPNFESREQTIEQLGVRHPSWRKVLFWDPASTCP